MAWQARNSDNSTRTPSAFVRRDKDNNVVAGGLLGRNAYDRHDKDNADVSNPGYATVTDDYGNQYKNWSSDYVSHLSDNSAEVALSGSGNSTLSGTLQDTQTLTVDGEATFSGGESPVTKEFQWQISDTGSGGWTGWGTGWTTYATTIIGETKVIATSDVGKYVRVQQRATDGDGTVATRAGTVYGAIIAA